MTFNVRMPRIRCARPPYPLGDSLEPIEMSASPADIGRTSSTTLGGLC